MKVSDLNATHPSYNAGQICEARDLFEGSARMRRNVKNHLLQNDQEPHEVYSRRCKSAHYVNYCGPMGGFFASFVASQPVRFDKADDTYWGDFAKDCDSKGTDFNTFFTTQLIEALTTSRAFWRVRFPEPTGELATLADVRAQGIDRATLTSIPTEQIIDWECDDEGRYLWVRQAELKQRRPGTGCPVRNVATWTQWNADGTAKRWEHEYDGDGAIPDTTDVQEIDPPYNPISKMPIVALELPPAIYLMGHLASPQLESFRKRCALSWSIERTCYAMPVFFMEDARKPPLMGAGYYIILGGKDRVEYPTPPAAPYATIGEYNKELVQELHRVSQAMARGIDNNAAAIGRSGESKQADDRATEIVVGAYADRLREAGQTTVDLIALGAARGEAPECGGFRGYKVLDAAATIEQFLGLQSAKIHSVTAMKEAEKLAVRAYLPDLSEDLRKKINDEIEEGMTAEELDAAREPIDLTTPPPTIPTEPQMEGQMPPLKVAKPAGK